MRTTRELTEAFRAAGRKVTPQRQCIFRVLEADDGHPSADMVFEAVRSEMATISRKTVYQTLHDLADLGEIAALDVGTGTMRFDPNVERSHHHLVCRGCGEVRDVFVDLQDLALPPGHAHGFDVGVAEVVFRGLCGGCRRTGSERDGAGHHRRRGTRRGSADHREHASQPVQEDQCPS
jgi:Fur family transcriptional regulator, stress-responsive regulator